MNYPILGDVLRRTIKQREAVADAMDSAEQLFRLSPRFIPYLIQESCLDAIIRSDSVDEQSKRGLRAFRACCLSLHGPDLNYLPVSQHSRDCRCYLCWSEAIDSNPDFVFHTRGGQPIYAAFISDMQAAGEPELAFSCARCSNHISVKQEYFVAMFRLWEVGLGGNEQGIWCCCSEKCRTQQIEVLNRRMRQWQKIVKLGKQLKAVKRTAKAMERNQGRS